MRNITKLRKACIDSIQRPEFLMTSSKKGKTLSDLAWNKCYLILINSTYCVSGNRLSKASLDDILNSIEIAAAELDVILDKQTLLLAWVWIYGLIHAWLTEAEFLEEYETCSNFKHIIDNIYEDYYD